MAAVHSADPADTAEREPMAQGSVDRDSTVAILTPTGRDAAMAEQVLTKAGLQVQVCQDMHALCAAIERGVGAVMIAEEALGSTARVALSRTLDAQPSWSEVSIIVLTVAGEMSRGVSPTVRALSGRGSVTLLERPVRVATLVTVLSSALRARQRQYDVRDHLAERLAAEQSLRESERRLRAAVQAAPYPMMLHTRGGRVVQLSRAWTDITGYSAQELETTLAWATRAHGDDEASAPRDAAEAFTLLSSGERNVRVRDGGTRTWDFHAASLGSAPDGDELCLTAAIDVTDFRASLRRERLSREAAEGANRAKSDFLAVMSHELRTPLNAIAGYCDILDLGVYGPITEQQRDALDRIKQSELRLLALINDVLNLAKIESGRLQIELAPVDLTTVCRSVEAMLLPQMLKKEQTYTGDYPPAGAVAIADGDKAGQVIVNLLSNAVKFTPVRGAVCLAVKHSKDAVQVIVSDTGPGIPRDKLDVIFEPFVQLGRTKSSVQEGTGLGLSISRDLARLMNGDLTVESRLGHGTTFTFCLPASTPQRSPA